MDLRQMDGCAAGLVAAGSLIGAFVTFIMACFSGNWGPFGDCCAMILVAGSVAASLGGKKPPQPVRYCLRCGTRHPLPLGPNCPR
jgi:hypothetical protein